MTTKQLSKVLKRHYDEGLRIYYRGHELSAAHMVNMYGTYALKDLTFIAHPRAATVVFSHENKPLRLFAGEELNPTETAVKLEEPK